MGADYSGIESEDNFSKSNIANLGTKFYGGFILFL